MHSASPGNDSRAALSAALEELRRRRAEIEGLRKERSEPIAVIGMACRFPGGSDTPERFWQLLSQGQNAITEIPVARWNIADYYDPDPAMPGKMSTRYGGFIEDVESFDPHFFGISPRETASLDPQQRLLLEVAWEAFENANLPPERVYRSLTGVFVGITCFDHAIRLGASPANFGAYAGTGSALNMAAGRLSYFFGLTGPSMAIDTACSSSLVALHLACESLRAKESNLALSGGVNLMLSPEVMVSFSQARMLSADGRSKTFDDAADGYVRGEGCGLVILKRVSDALADGDTILGLVRGSAVNQGGPSGGLTVPSGLAQQRVIERALQQAGASPHEVDYVEAHGTGTSLGDPIEIEALDKVYGESRGAQNSLLTGSVKTNIGHLEPASGVAGLIKLLLSFRHETIPAQLHFARPNTHISWDNIAVRVASVSTPWTRGERKRVAGLSAFGFSGTNAHAIIEEPPQSPSIAAERNGQPRQLLTLSAKSEAALQELATRYAEWLLNDPETNLPALCRSASQGRNHFPFRLAISARSTTELCEELSSFASNGAASRARAGKTNPTRQPKIAFLFTGQGSQSVGMSWQLYETESLFKSVMDKLAGLFSGLIEVPLLDVIFGREVMVGLLDQTAYTQPALFAVEYALAELWKSWGIKPSVVIGHSVGEYVAACQAGVITLEDGVRLIAERARLMQQLPQTGAMLTVFAGRQIVGDAIKPYGADVAIAALNSPNHTVISGRIEAIEAVGKHLRERDIRVQALRVSHAFHSPLMKPMLNEFRRLARQVHFSKPFIKIVSNLTGELVNEEMRDPEYWVRHIVEPVNFAGGMQTLSALEPDVCLEIGPEPVLTMLGREGLGGESHRWLFSLRSKQDNRDTMLDALAALYVMGAEINWSAVYRDQPPSAVTELPNYPFQRHCYRIEQRSQPNTPALATPEAEHLLLKRLEQSGQLSTEALRLAPEILQALSNLNPPDEKPDGLFYRVIWEAKDRLPQRTGLIGKGNRWLIFADSAGLGKTLADLLTAQDQSCTLVYAGYESGVASDGVWHLRPDSAEDFSRLMREVSAAGIVERAIFLWGLNAPTADELTPAQLERCQTEGCGAVLNLIQTAAEKLQHLLLVTRGAVAVREDAGADGLAQSPLWGFGKGILLERPALAVGCIDLDPAKSASEAEMLSAEIVERGAEGQVAFRAGERWVPRLTKITTPVSERAKIAPEGAYLITGGFGALGLQVAGWLVVSGARELVLVSRSGCPKSDEAQDALAALRASGASVIVEQSDVACEENMTGLFARLRASGTVLRGIVHAAGVPGYCPVEELEPADLQAMLRPKVTGAWLVHQLSLAAPLDFFVLFSSVASVWGSRGQAHYSAANRFLDVLALHRRALGLPALCINWGPWAEGGMTSAEAETLLRRVGVRALKPQIAIQALDQMLAAGMTDAVFADVDWSLFRDSYEARGKQPFLERLPVSKPSKSEPTPATDFVEQLRAATPAERKRQLLHFIQKEVAQVLALGAQLPEPEQGFFEMGMDSLLSLEFKARLETALACRLPATLIFDNPTIRSLTEYLAGEVWGKVVSRETERNTPEHAQMYRRAATLEQMSDAEAEALLLQKLETIS